MSDITRAGAKAQARGFVILANGLEMPAPSGGARRDRTDDLLLAKQALSQLSYGPFRDQASAIKDQDHQRILIRKIPIPDTWSWWAWEDLNFRPHAYQARALTN
jgi:hypothetical protein